MDNKAIVTKFYQEVFQAEDLSHLDTYMRDDYLQHNHCQKWQKGISRIYYWIFKNATHH